MDPIERLKNFLLPPDVAEQFDALPAATGEFARDPWGFDKARIRYVFGVAKRLYDDYFRVQTSGLENVPVEGRVLLIGNHSGQLPVDGFLLAMAVATNPNGPRAARAMIERFFPTVPFVGNLLNQMGAVIGDPQNCRRMLENEEAIIVFPEGVRGSGKLFRDRYQLQRFGHGFMHLAINHATPIVPVGIVGCEETMPSLANLAPLAKLLGIPYLPVTTPLPLPARVSLHFGAPMRFEGAADEAQITANVEAVKTAIRGLLDDGLAARKQIF